MSNNWKLAQEIYEEFLTCRICLDSFKSPKSLSCLHVFCEQCIENHLQGEASYKKYSDYRDFTCPICRKRTPVPTGGVKKLPDNFLIANLGETIGRQRSSSTNQFSFCDICRTIQRKHREASSKCLDCNKLLCKTCVDTHRETKVTKLHSIFDMEIEKDVMCKEHREEAVRFFCEPCGSCICVLCAFADHHDHDVADFAESAQRYQSVIRELLERCTNNLTILERQLDSVTRGEQRFKQAEQSIHDVAIEYISEIRSREKQMVEELHKMYGKRAIELFGKKTELQTQVEQLKNACNLTQIVLTGKDIELLLLKKQLEEKLVSLAALPLCDTPRGMQKEIKFIPGQLNLGSLVDGETTSAPTSPSNSLPQTPNRRKACSAIFTFPPVTMVSNVKLLSVETSPTAAAAAAATSASASASASATASSSFLTSDATTMTSGAEIELPVTAVATEKDSNTAEMTSETRSRALHRKLSSPMTRSSIILPVCISADSGSSSIGEAMSASTVNLGHEGTGFSRREAVGDEGRYSMSVCEPSAIQAHFRVRRAANEYPLSKSRRASSTDENHSCSTPVSRRRDRRRRIFVGPSSADCSAALAIDD